MNLLCFDVSGPVGSIAVFKDSTCVSYTENPERRTHASKLLPLIEEALADGGLAYGDLDAIVTCVGPGSFTGIRVGLATAKGLEIATKKPVYGLTSFQVAYWKAQQAAPAPLPTLVVIEALREDVYCQYFQTDGTAAAPQNLPPEDLKPLVGSAPFRLTGSALLQAEPALQAQGLSFESIHQTCTAKDLGHQVLSFTEEQQKTCKDTPLEPFYLRPPDINLKS